MKRKFYEELQLVNLKEDLRYRYGNKLPKKTNLLLTICLIDSLEFLMYKLEFPLQRKLNEKKTLSPT